MMEKLVTCESEEAKGIVLSEVPARSLIRHLEKSDLGVNKGAILLLNSFHKNSNERIQAEIVEVRKGATSICQFLGKTSAALEISRKVFFMKSYPNEYKYSKCLISRYRY